MITKLPVALPALADEAGFSVLARNTHSNASRTTFEFCSAVGLSKSDICTGQPSALKRLSELTGSFTNSLLANSPQQRSRRLTSLGSNKLLTRSLRKTEQMICPACWQEDMQHSKSQLHIRKHWLPTFSETCVKHSLALIPLPLIDYTSCYDHIMRAAHVPGWLQRLDESHKSQIPSAFELAASQTLDNSQPICPWLGDIQMDAMADWSLGLAMLLQNLSGRPDQLAKEDHRQLTATGYEVTIKGRRQLDKEIDAALARYKKRISASWLMTWVTQTTKPPERQQFRKLLLEISANQGQYGLTNVSSISADQHLVDSEIHDIARSSKRSKAWVLRSLRREGLLPSFGIPETSDLKQHMKRCRRYILRTVESLDTTKSAKHLNIGIKGFEALVEGGVVPILKSKSHKSARFSPVSLDQVLSQLEQHTIECNLVTSPEYCSISEACFIYRLTTEQIARLLFAGLLPSSKRIVSITGFLGIRVKRDEILISKHVFTEEQVTPRNVCRRLGLSADELHTLQQLNILPSLVPTPGRENRANKTVGVSILKKFLKRYQTISTAARELQINPDQLKVHIIDANIRPAKDFGGLPIYYRSDLLD